jgi:hypothetical protein
LRSQKNVTIGCCCATMMDATTGWHNQVKPCGDI